MAMPYFSINLNWIDVSSDNISQNAGSTEYQDVDFQIRTVGALGVVKSTSWDGDSALPSASSTFIADGKDIVAYDYHIMAEATIAAGKYAGRNCTVSPTAIGNATENIAFNPSQQVVSASIDKSKL
ncbi:hypothetical protein B7494_g5370 [Chlorociboria aeruginascens]|nr:hypothetical protein B7494_g5370 [Chlorociboria aeruginascens]